MLSEVEQEQRPSGNGEREAIVVGASLYDGEGERAYTGFVPHGSGTFRHQPFGRQYGVGHMGDKSVDQMG